MADVQVSCSKCGKTITLSEFVDRNGLTCHGCGEPLLAPEAAAGSSRAKPSLKKNGQPDPSTDPTEATGEVKQTAWQRSQQAAIDGRPKKKFEMTHVHWSWFIFIFLGLIMAYLRYGGGFLQHNIPFTRTYGPIVVITLHVMIILCGFKDSVFQGTLCTIVPMYSLYYILAVSDNFYLRSVCAGVLVGIGQDTGIVFSEWAQNFFTASSTWINNGGGVLQKTH